jgi:peptidyl-tRNA hydrolase, PTH1 family
MKIIVGLGNPGKKYENTRHNVGFLAMDKIIEKISNNQHPTSNQYPISNIQYLQPFKLDKKFDAEMAKLKLGNEDIILVKPQTFMNLSGKAVKKIVDFYKINPEKDLIVVYDDIDIPLGKTRIRAEGSAAGHNGLQSIIDELGTDRFMRVRIGIGRPASTGQSSLGGPSNELMKVEDWVLQELPDVEKEVLFNVLQDLIVNGLQYLAL